MPVINLSTVDQLRNAESRLARALMRIDHLESELADKKLRLDMANERNEHLEAALISLQARHENLIGDLQP